MAVPIGIVGGGAFGRALAVAATRRGHEVVLRTSRPQSLGDRIRVTSDFGDLADAELVFITVPSVHTTSIARELAPHLDGSHLLVHVSRGLVGPELRTVSQILRAETPVRRVGALAGPLVPTSLLEGKPAAAVLGSVFPEVIEAVRGAVSDDALLIYGTSDIIGVEAAAALVGIMIVGVGYALALDLGPSILGLVGTRGIVEASRVGRALGANEPTFGGLAGLGDLLGAIAGEERPELRLGQALGRARPLEAAVRDAHTFVEAVSLAPRIAEYCERKAIAAPVLTALARIVEGTLAPPDAISLLMNRRAAAPK